MRKKIIVTLLIVFITWSNWHYVVYLYNTITLDSNIKILPTDKTEEVMGYQELLSHKVLSGKPGLVLINNGWTREKLLKLDHPRIYANCEQEGWNLIYLSNEFGDQKYNRTKANWLNRICSYNMLGYHLYPSEPFELFDKYINKVKTQTGETYAMPHALILNNRGNVTDTLYSYNKNEISRLIK